MQREKDFAGLRRVVAGTVAAVGILVPATAGAATLSVDDNLQDCPAAGFTSIQSAVTAATAGDTVAVCPGTYVEGASTGGTTAINALTVDKNLTIRGAGADLVRIVPRGRIAANTPVVRNTTGAIIAATGTPAAPITVDISGVTVSGGGFYSEIGVLFIDAQGSLYRSRVTDIVTSERAEGETTLGGFRNTQVGYGVVQTSAGTGVTGPVRPLSIVGTRVDRYNKAGILIDGATNDTPPLTPSGALNEATITGTSVVGRLRCIDFETNGNCATVGTLTTGTLFGQDGLRVTAGSTAAIHSSAFFQNFVNGTGAPVFSPNSGAPVSTNNGNLSLGSGIRMIGAGASTVAQSNIADNHYGLYNVGLDGTTPNTTTPVVAEGNWWGLRRTGTTTNLGPQISPATNPAEYENPVNGTPTAIDPTCQGSAFGSQTPPPPPPPGSNSDAVDFCPFRNGPQSDPDRGEVAIPDAPLPVNDAAPTVTVNSDAPSYERGEEATITATAGDDFGVKSVSFYDGAELIGTAPQLPPYELEMTVPLDAPCDTRTITAVVEDSLGQTASDTVDIEVVDPLYDCAAAPTISLDVPGTIGPGGATASATTVAESGVDTVTFFLGNRELCVVASPPYSCEVLPTGDEVGEQTLRAVVTDDDGRTAEESSTVTVSKFSAALGLDPVTRKKKRSRKRAITGRLSLPARVSSKACEGAVTLKVTRRGKPIANLQATLGPSADPKACTFWARLRLTRPNRGKKKVFSVAASFAGNAVLLGAETNRRFR
jgi:hypothetical protein